MPAFRQKVSNSFKDNKVYITNFSKFYRPYFWHIIIFYTIYKAEVIVCLYSLISTAIRIWKTFSIRIYIYMQLNIRMYSIIK